MEITVAKNNLHGGLVQTVLAKQPVSKKAKKIRKVTSTMSTKTLFIY